MFISALIILITYILSLNVSNSINLSEIKNLSLNQYIVMNDADGKFISRYGDLHEYVLYKDIPKSIINCLVATEDQYFWHHKGLNIPSMARAVAVNLTKKKIVKGGSTITQQLAKNLLISYEPLLSRRKTERKIREFIITLRLEQAFNKEEIIEYYLNRIYFGRGAYGIVAAASIYFNKALDQLSLLETAFLIGLVQAPSRYSQNQNEAINRAKHVLNRLRKVDLINDNEITNALQSPINIAIHNPKYKMGCFTDWALGQIPKWIRDSDRNIKVETTIDIELQKHLVESIDHIKNKSRFDFSELATVACERNGSIKVMLGGINNIIHGFNRATQAFRQAGSTFKIWIYLLGLLNGLRLEELIDDTPPTIGNWTPSNYFHNEIGLVSVEDAFAQSINAPTVRIAMRYGISNIINLARQLGVTGPIPNDCSMILGSASITVTQLVQTLLIIANEGRYITPYGIREICDYDSNEVLWSYDDLAGSEIVINNQEALDNILHLMERVVESPRGTGRAAKSKDYPIGGKTGTSQEYRDLWFASLTPFMIAVTWCGHDDFRPMNKIEDKKPRANPAILTCKSILDKASQIYKWDQ